MWMRKSLQFRDRHLPALPHTESRDVRGLHTRREQRRSGRSPSSEENPTWNDPDLPPARARIHSAHASQRMHRSAVVQDPSSKPFLSLSYGDYISAPCQAFKLINNGICCVPIHRYPLPSCWTSIVCCEVQPDDHSRHCPWC